MLFLPRPVSGGKLEDLRQHFNVTDDDDFWLLVGSILAAFRGQGPYPITVLNGEQGSAKSTMARMLRHLIDPNRASARSLQQKEDDLYIAASNGYVLSFDNVSYLNPAISDALCRISTGGGFSKRELYTDLDEIIIDLCRPILMNGIPSLVERPDLMDRAITLTLPSIPPEQRRTEQSVWSEFDLARPALLGSICAAASKALSCIDEIKIIDSPRLIDLVIFMTAVERGLGLEEGRFLRIYTDHQRRARIDLAAADPLVSLIEEIIKDQPFKGTATELRAKIKTKLDGENRWPSGVPRLPNRLTGALRRLAPALRELGITVELEGGRDDDNRKIIKITTGARF